MEPLKPENQTNDQETILDRITPLYSFSIKKVPTMAPVSIAFAPIITTEFAGSMPPIIPKRVTLATMIKMYLAISMRLPLKIFISDDHPFDAPETKRLSDLYPVLQGVTYQ
tara:strand:+ start:121393 stop:121725 length:333 start_codon:yes stop_codon:yes gene_type:complete